MQPRIVPADSTIVPYDANRVPSAALKPCRAAISRTDVGTCTDPAHSPTIDTSKYIEFNNVRRAYIGEKIRLNAVSIGGCCAALSRPAQVADSRTPYLMKVTSSAGVPPTANIQRQPYRAPIV